jgi:lipopolysaccharide heptosyltransferase I
MKIAIVKLSALGDIVHAMVALQYLKQAISDISIDWIVEERFAGVLQDNPDINQILPVNLKSLKKDKRNFWHELQKVRGYSRNQYDLVIDAQGLIKSALTARLLSSSTAGFDKASIREKPAAWFYQKTVHCAYDANTIDRNVTVIGQPLGVTITPQQILDKQSFLFYKPSDPELEHFFATNKPNVVYVTGSTWPSRNYPKEQFLQLIEQLDVNSLVIWGSQQEKETAEWLAERSKKASVLPRLNFNNLKAVLDRANLVIGNDTGPTHMAWGLNTPSITLFGPTPISRVYQTPINKVLKSPSDVDPFKLNKHDFSIKEISVHAIINTAKFLLGNNNSR